MTTFNELQKEICVKFFNTPNNYTASKEDKILYISNPDKTKDCQPYNYNYTGNIVYMPIGYKCIEKKDIAQIVVSMLKASIEQTVSSVNSYDLIKKFQDWDMDKKQPTMLSPTDRNYINAHYFHECGSLSTQYLRPARRYGVYFNPDEDLTEDNKRYYQDKMWPLAIVMYDVESRLRGTPDHTTLKYAMTTIELGSCLVFQDISDSDNVLSPKNFLWFGSDGEEMPELGFKEGNQTIQLSKMVHGAPGHESHALNNVMRALGLPMMSNRNDRDNYIVVNWKNVEKSKEHYLEKIPDEGWLGKVPYDFDSVTHAPANYMCGDCRLGQQTVQPLQDNLWQRTLSMGHKTELSETDKQTLKLLYGKQCQNRFSESAFKEFNVNYNYN